MCAGIERHTHARVVKLPPDTHLAGPEAYHPDMIMSVFDGMAFLPEEYLASNGHIADELSSLGLNVTACREARGKSYPRNVSLNVLVADDFALLNPKSVSPLLLSNLGSRRIIGTAQGYAACSTLYAAPCAVTADKGIYKALTAEGVEVLLIGEGHISLEPYSYGFIGGASFVVGDTVFTFGDIASHPDHGAITSFLRSCGKRIVPLSSSPLADYGGAVVVTSNVKI